MDEPEVRYAKSGDVHIAYQTFGSGSVNIVSTPGTISHLDYYWKPAGLRHYFESLGEFARIAMFDKRGTGLSDRNAGVPTFEERTDDIRAVMDAAHFADAVLLGHSEGVPMSILFAATYPTRTKGLILYGGQARGSWAPDYPWEGTREEWEDSFERIEKTWGTKEAADRSVSYLAPSRLGDGEFTQWISEMNRMGGSPGAAIALGKSEMNMDVRSILPAIHVPTLVIRRTGDKACNVEEGRYIARHIPGARFVELPGIDHFFFFDNEITERILQEIRTFSTQLEPVTQSNRILTTVLFTDISGSTKKATELGDSMWQNLLDRHNSLVKDSVHRFQGVVIKNTGDGFLATFDGPTRAIKCAWDITRSANALGIEVRAGVHTGECIVGVDVTGIAVHTASRVLDEAAPGEVLVSGTVRDLVFGSGVSFADRGEHDLKGIEEKRHLYAVTAAN